MILRNVPACGGFSLVLTLAVAACAPQPADCNPTQVNSVFTAGACQIFGTSQRRVDTLQAEADAKVAAYRLTQEETRALLIEADRLAADRALWEARVAEIDRNLASLQRRLNRQRGRTQEDQARLDALKAQLIDAQRQLDNIAQDESVTRAEIETLTLEVERRRQAIEFYLNEIDVVE